MLKALDQLEAVPEAAEQLQATLARAAVLVPLLGLAAYRFYIYSQLEYITAAMLSRHVPREAPGARVIQVGGGTKELYYYPKNILQVTVVGEKVNKGLLEQAGIQAGVPTVAKVQAPSKLGFALPSSLDAVVSLGTVGAVGATAAASFLAEAARVLKPGRPLIFIEKDKDTLLSILESSQADWDSAEYDLALPGPDAVAVGVALKRSEGSAGEGNSSSSSSVVGARRRTKIKQRDESKGFV